MSCEFCFSVPLDIEKRKSWIQAIESYQEFDYVPAIYSICEFHFAEGEIVKRGNRRMLAKGVVPTLFGENSRLYFVVLFFNQF